MSVQRVEKKLSLHVRVLGIGFFVVVILFGSALYYYDRAEAHYTDDRVATKTNYITKVVTLLVERSVQMRDVASLKVALQHLLHTDQDLASLRILAPQLSPYELYLVQESNAVSPARYEEHRRRVTDPSGRELATIAIGFWKRGMLEESSEFSVLNTIIVCDLVVLFGLMLHLMLRELVTRPLESFVEATRRIAVGDLTIDTAILSGSTREEERLAVSFQEMVSHIRESREQLSRVNAELEERVASRTEELRLAKNASEIVITSIADGLYTVDANRVIRVFNAAAEKLSGMKAAEVIGRRCYEVFDFPFCKTNCILQRLQRMRDPGVASGKPGEEYLEELKSHGRTWLVSGALFDGQSGFGGGVETIKDLSYARKLQQQIRQMDKLTSLGILSAGVAHEINNPLSNIKIYGQLLQEDIGRAPVGEGAKESLKQILDQTDRASSIVRKMLEFSRQSQAGMESLDLSEIISQSLDMVRYMLGAKGVEVTVDIEPHLPRIAGSRVALQQVLVNLFNNAWQAMQEGGRLTVRAGYDRGSRSIHVTVSDTGAGIKECDLGRIFDPFFTTKDVGEGTGLGLSISYGIIRDHRGELSVESTEGRGTTFTIALPVMEAAASAAVN